MKKHEEITLDNVSKSFEYERISREIDQTDDIEKLRDIAKCYIKLYFKQQEVLVNLNFKLLDK